MIQPPRHLDRQPPTPEEFAQEMTRIAAILDDEQRHMEADALMIAALSTLGYGVGAVIFLKMEKWYA